VSPPLPFILIDLQSSMGLTPPVDMNRVDGEPIGSSNGSNGISGWTLFAKGRPYRTLGYQPLSVWIACA